ncbi:ABC transporter ATP-binding protein [Pseudochelatococcus sp. B33]
MSSMLPTMHGSLDVELRSIRKTYGRGPAAVDDVSLVVPGGQFATFLGPSGSGKTTTLMAIAGFVAPDAGDVLIGGRSMTSVPPHKRSIGVVFQHYALFPHMTVFENIAYPLRTRRMPAEEVRTKVQKTLDLIRLPDIGTRYPRELSGGQQQRVALGRALVFEPSIMLMDEPLGALDRKLREQMQIELRALQQTLGITTISVTHDQEEAMALSDLVIVMKDGRVEQQGTPRELYEQPRTPFIADFLGISNLIPGGIDNVRSAQVFKTSDGLSFSIGDIAPDTSTASHLMIRPERVRWTDDGPLDVTVEGRVSAVVYLGSQIRCHLTLANGSELVSMRVNRPGLRPPEVGEVVTVGWRHDDAILL